MDKKTQLWNLYKQLKDEITLSDSRNSQIKGLLITASGLILSLGFNQENPERPWIILGIFVVIVPLYGMLFGNRKNIWRISTYLRTFVEPELEEIKWESRLDTQRNIASSKDRKNYSSEASAKEFDLVKYLSGIALLILTINFLYYLAIILQNNFTTLEYLKVENADSLNSNFLNSLITTIIGYWAYFKIVKRMGKESKDLERLGKIEKNYLESWIAIKDEEKRRREANKA